MKDAMKKTIRAMPKAELHRHLEGSVRTRTIIELARKHKLPLPTFDEPELDKIVKLKEPMKSLADVLRLFTIAQSVFVSLEAVERITHEALEDAAERENIRLLELRYSPDFMLRGKGLDWAQAHAVIAKTIRAFEKKHDLVGGIIVIASRCYGLESAARTVEFALAHRKTVIGFDFADNENDYPPALFKDLVPKLHAAGIPLTVHSGEEGTPEAMRQTIELLSPRRIGHGVKAAEDRTGRTLDLVRRRGITLETNPISNWLTHAVPALEAHPLKRFLDSGVKATIGADDPGALDTDLNKEYAAAVEEIGLSLADLRRANEYAVQGSFLEGDKRQQAERWLKAAPASVCG